MQMYNIHVTNNKGYWPMDINGDGHMDIVQGWKDDKDSICFVSLLSNKVDGFNKGTTNHCPGSYGGDNFRTFFPMDHNGDGRTDLVQVVKNNSIGSNNMRVLRSVLNNNGAYELAYAGETPTDGPSGINDYQYFAANINGDRCSDIIRVKTDNSNLELSPYISNACSIGGYPFSPSVGTSIPSFSYYGNFTNSKVSISDIDGNGLEDIIYTTTSENSLTDLQVLPFLIENNRFTYTEANKLVYPKNGIGQHEYIAMDVNKDGLGDIVRAGEKSTRCNNNSLFFRSILSTKLPNNTYSFSIDNTIEQPMPNAYGHIKFIPMDVDGDHTLDIVQVLANEDNLSYITYLLKHDNS